MILQSPRDGVFKGYNLDFSETEYENYLVNVEITAEPGDFVSELRKGTDRIGKVVTTGTTSLDAEKKATEIAKKIVIEVD